MRTPSLHRRVTAGGVAVFLVLVIALQTIIFFTLQARLEDSLEAVLASRVELVRELDESHSGEQLAERLSVRAVPATVTTPDGQTFESGSVPRFERNIPGPGGGTATERISTEVALADGGTAEVFVSRSGVEDALRQVRGTSLVGLVIAVVVAGLLFRRAAVIAIAPLEEIVAATRRTASGQRGQRLEPDAPTTELGQFATAYDQMLDALEDALDRAASSEERTRQFVDDAAHQLRTPLATVRATTETLLHHHDAEVRDQLMASLVREVARADRLVSALLTLARLDGDRPSQVASIDLAELCADEVDRARSLAPHLDLTIAVEGDDPHVTLDGAAIREAIANLLDNARRHAQQRVEVTVTLTRADVQVRIHDDGPGLAEEDRERAFQRFTTLDGRGGSGLGLAIGQTIAERHGGTLVYEAGSFVLDLPRVATGGSDTPQL